jgi:hypothetical protein
LFHSNKHMSTFFHYGTPTTSGGFQTSFGGSAITTSSIPFGVGNHTSSLFGGAPSKSYVTSEELVASLERIEKLEETNTKLNERLLKLEYNPQGGVEAIKAFLEEFPDASLKSYYKLIYELK